MSETDTSTPTPPPTPSPAPAPDVAAPVTATPGPVRRGNMAWLQWLALLLAVAALLGFGLLWQRLGQTQQELARRVQDNALLSAESRALAAQAQSQMQELQAKLAVAEVKLSEVMLQRSQLEELMLTLSRSRDDNLVQDIESALRLAQQQAQLTGSVQPLVSALQAADQRIARAAQPRLNPVQRAIARDLQRVLAAEFADVPSLVQRLDELSGQVEQWPLLNDVGPRQAAARPPLKSTPTTSVLARSSTTASTPVATTGSVATSSTPTSASVAAGDASASAGWRGWWDRLLGDLVLRGSELVRVSRIDHPEAALVSPEQAFFLRGNAKMHLLNARLGLLARQSATAQADVRAVQSMLERYFDGQAPSVQAAQQALGQLRTELVPLDLPRPDESLAALAAAAGGR